jgi:menaquinone-specific isochorismate synthase
MSVQAASIEDLNAVIEKLKTLRFKGRPLTLNGKTYSWMHFKLSFTITTPLLALNSKEVFPQVLWHEKDTGASNCCFGSALTLDCLPSFTKEQENLPLEFFVAKDFDKRKTNLWTSFPSLLCFLPLLSFHQTFFLSRANTALMRANFFSQQDIERAISFLSSMTCSHLTAPQAPTGKSYLPALTPWKNHVERIKHQIEKSSYQKVVLARLASFSFNAPLDPYSTLMRLTLNPGKGTAFCIKMGPETAFLGLTPELLYKRLGKSLTTMALAGTIRRGSSEKEDAKLAGMLMASAKDFHEFDLVRVGIAQALKNLCVHTDKPFDDVSVLKTAHVQHLFSPIKRTLMPKTSDAMLIQALHPTPAICGLPKTASLKAIFSAEPFDRGYYSAPLGFVSPSQCQLHVAIRSGLITGSTLHLFSGAGITSQSQAQKEWDEINAKLQPFLLTLKPEKGASLSPKEHL